MQRETLTAHAGTTPVTRATIEPYVDGVPGPRFYQRYAHGVGLDAERLLGELDGGRALLFGSGMAAICSLALATSAACAAVSSAPPLSWVAVAVNSSDAPASDVACSVMSASNDPMDSFEREGGAIRRSLLTVQVTTAPVGSP